jgi:hypothetical protein
MKVARIVRCKDCNMILNQQAINENFSNCDACGSENISYELFLSDNLVISEKIKGKIKEEGIKKPRREFIYGDELYKKANKMVYKTRIIDWENDRYYEKVVDKENDAIIHECEEPLSQHFDHGSAKIKKN